MLITITGELGSGKSTVSHALEKELGWPRYSAGDAQRKVAASMGITTLEMNRLADEDPAIDQKIDSVFVDLAQNDQMIIDARLAFHFIPNSLKIKLNVSSEEAVSRIFNDASRVSEGNRSDKLEVRKNTLARRESERQRFIKSYGVDVDDDSNFDLVIDTAAAEISDIVELIKQAIDKRKTGLDLHRCWAAAASLYPIEPITDFYQKCDVMDVVGSQRCASVLKENVSNVYQSLKESGFDVRFPVTIVRDKEVGNFILDGHKRTSGSIASGVHMIPVTEATEKELAAFGGKQTFVEKNKRPANWYDWEDALGLRFSHYPALDR